MYQQIRVSDETLRRLKACAEPFVDREPDDVLRRLLDEHDKRNGSTGAVARMFNSGRTPSSRVPRERGTQIRIGSHEIKAVSVRDLYEKALAFLVDNHGDDLDRLAPLSTSRERYLVAKKPIHPNGNHFVVLVEYHGYYMEAHKDYENAIAHLRGLTEKLGLKLEYLA